MLLCPKIAENISKFLLTSYWTLSPGTWLKYHFAYFRSPKFFVTTRRLRRSTLIDLSPFFTGSSNSAQPVAQPNRHQSTITPGHSDPHITSPIVHLYSSKPSIKLLQSRVCYQSPEYHETTTPLRHRSLGLPLENWRTETSSFESPATFSLSLASAAKGTMEKGRSWASRLISWMSVSIS
jgi:hypothetical protein